MLEISAKNGVRDVILGCEGKTSDLAAHYSRNSGAANTFFFTIQTVAHPGFSQGEGGFENFHV